MSISREKPWLRFYSPEALEKSLPENTIYELLINENKNSFSKVALEYYGTKITFSEMFSEIERYAIAFSRAGVKKGDYVSLYTVSLPETIYSIYALNKIGAVSNFIDVRTDAGHALEFIAHAKSKILVVLDLFLDKIYDGLENLDLDKVIVQSASDSLPFTKKHLTRVKTVDAYKNKKIDNKFIVRNSEFVANSKGYNVTAIPYEKDRAAVVVRTGGTTGVSKGVVLTDDNINSVFADMRVLYTNTDGQCLLNFLPLAASYGFVVGIHAPLCASIREILIPNFKPETFGDLIYKYRPNHIIGVPVFYENMMKNRKLQNMDLSFIITMGAGGDSANPDFENELATFAKNHGVHYSLASGYGMSETSSACCYGVLNNYKPGSVGIPSRSTTISIFEPGTTNELGYNEQGEVCITGPAIMKEYLDNPEETKNVMWKHPDGKTWIHSGDLGYMDEDGFLYIEGRLKRSIIRFDGHKSYPTQIEDVASKHPAVKECCAIPIKDKSHRQGELPLIVVELEEKLDVEDLDQTRAEILEFTNSNIEERSQSYDVVIIDKMPITVNGKKDIQNLIERFSNYMHDKNNQ